MRWVIPVVAALCVSAAPAIAQEAGQKQMGQQGGQQTQAADKEMKGATEAWKGNPVYSSDDQLIGEVVRVELGPAGQAQTIHVKTGQELGIGERTIKIDTKKAHKSGDRVELQGMTAEEVKQLPSSDSGQKQ